MLVKLWNGYPAAPGQTLNYGPPSQHPYTQPTASPRHGMGGRRQRIEFPFWVSTVGLYSGSRLGELCQLRAVDIQTLEGIAVLVLTDDGEGQNIKTNADRRCVPIHSELIRLGFLDYVATVQATPAHSLWPALKLRKGKPSGYFSRWFSEFRKGVGLGKYPDFHCLRHTVRPLMRRAGHSEATMDKVTGHETKGSVGTVTYDHWTLAELQTAVESIRFPCLSLLAVARCSAS